jgi:hypothetical protein
MTLILHCARRPLQLCQIKTLQNYSLKFPTKSYIFSQKLEIDPEHLATEYDKKLVSHKAHPRILTKPRINNGMT